jgi:DNA-binding NarL/FixJ family response regulator
MRALIVTDNPLSASAIHRAMRDVSIRAVIGGYVNASRPCTGTVAQIEPDVVIVDETGTPDNALARIAEIRAALVDVKIVLLTASMDESWLAKATTAGIDAAIRKTPQAVSLGALVREVMAGNVYHAFAQPQAKSEPAQATGLTTRELEILRLVAAGASNSTIGAQLWITEQTVKFHLSNVYRKLGVANRTQASRFAYLNGLIEPIPANGAATTPVFAAA